MKRPKRISIPVVFKSRKKKIEVERVTPEYAQYIEEEPQITSTAGQPQSLYMKMVDSTNWKLVGETVGIVALVAFVAVVLYWGIKQ